MRAFWTPETEPAATLNLSCLVTQRFSIELLAELLEPELCQ